MTSRTILITGATGFLGRELLRHLLAGHRADGFVALVRAPDDLALERRRHALLANVPASDAQRVRVVRGDMTEPRLGLEARSYERLADAVDQVIHCAASTRFDLSLADARRENVQSTAHVLALCRTIRSRG